LNEAGLLLNLGNTCSTRISGAEYYKQALQVCQEIGHRRTESAVLGNLGNVSFIALADYANARNYYEQCLRICREIGDRRVESIVLSFFVLLLLQQDEKKTVLDYSQQALRIAQETGNRDAEGYAFTSLGRTLETRERLTEAANAYRQAIDVRSEIGQHHMALEPLAGLVRISLQQGKPDQAQSQVEEILSFLGQGNTLESFSEPFLAYWSCYRVLHANQDPRAEDLLNEAHRLLQEWAARIDNEELRRSFLENVPYHREIRHEHTTRFA
jgi:ATP/maltotriose-dependent transcriptional regulator MalT